MTPGSFPWTWPCLTVLIASMPLSVAFAEDSDLKPRIGVIGAVDTPIIYFAANMWSQAHPPIITGPAADAESSLGSDLGMVLLVTTTAFTFLFIYLVQTRYKIRKSEDDIVELKRASSASVMTGAN